MKVMSCTGIDGKEKIIKVWADDVDEKVTGQLNNLAKLPFMYKWPCLMPDGHLGYGMPIGGVLATKGVVIPNAVGVDIGCGMIAAKLPFTDMTKDQLKRALGLIRKTIPTGFKHHKKPQDMALMPKKSQEFTPVVNDQYNKALYQLGTLGGGNHFIEIQRGSDGYIWIMIHSGSRNLGYTVAKYYNNMAKDLNKFWFSEVSEKSQLAFLPLKSKEGRKYLSEMQFCVEFAAANRKLMMERVLRCVYTGIISPMVRKGLHPLPPTESDIQYVDRFMARGVSPEIQDIAHNYAALENHYGENVVVHRKGATKAYLGTVGIIPGSQGTSSYIVRGKGNPESFQSCSHGAGRLMSRTAAKENLSLEEEQKFLDDQEILHSVRGKANLDEAPGAYKNIDKVMKLQSDLVDIVIKLRPIGVVKG